MAESPVDFLQEWAQEVTDAIRNNLVSKDAWFDQSTLAQSIVALPVEVVPDGYVLRIQMNDYGQYVDGSRGKTVRKVSSGQTVQSKLAGADGWIARRAINLPMVIRVKKKTKNGIKFYDRRFKNRIEANKSLSFAISSKIHDRGFVSKGKGFYSEIVNGEKLTELTQMLSDKFGATFEADIIE